MSHYILTSNSVRNIQIALEHDEWGMTRNRPINIGDTIELRTRKDAEDGGNQHVVSAIVTSEPIHIQNPDFQWPDGE